MNHERKESLRVARILRKSWPFRERWRIRRRFMPIKPTPTMPMRTMVLRPFFSMAYARQCVLGLFNARRYDQLSGARDIGQNC